MKVVYLVISFFIALFIAGCGGGSFSSKVADDTQVKQRIVFGVAQKGPAIEGGLISLYELDAGAERTGKILHLTTSGKQGGFAFKLPVSWHNAVEVVFSGRYFNEAIGSISTDAISLSTIVLLQDKTQVSANINILSTMVAARMRALVRQNKLSLQEAYLSASTSVKNIAGVSAEQANDVDITRDDSAQDAATVLFLSGIVADLAKKYQKPTQQLISQLVSNFAIDGQLSGVAEIWESRLKKLAINREKVYTDKYSSHLSRYMRVTSQVPTSTSLPDAITFTSRPVANIEGEADLIVEPNTTVILDGSKSVGENNKPIKFTWFQTDHGKDRLKLKDRFGSKLSFVTPDKENITMQFTLLLNDSDGMTDSETIRVTTAKLKPSIDEFVGLNKITGESVENTIFVNEGEVVNFQLQINNPLGGELSYKLSSAPSYGEVLFPFEGTVARLSKSEKQSVNARYISHGGGESSDAFALEVVDERGNKGSLRVSVTISPVNDDPSAKDDIFTVTEGEDLTGNVLNNDTDEEGDELTVSLVNNSEELNLTADGEFTYRSSEKISEDVTKTFPYELSDGNGGASTANIIITITPTPNKKPVATNDSFDVQKNDPTIIDVLLNDTDLDGDDLTVSTTSQPVNGSVTVNNNSLLLYTPNQGFSGIDSFTYTVDDGRSGQDTATVSIHVINTKPIAQSQSLTTDKNISLNIVLSGADSDGDELTFTVSSTTSAGGSLINSPTGSKNINYTPANGFVGTDSFSFSVSDGEDSSSNAIVTIEVEAVNQLPIAVITGAVTPVYEGREITLDASSSSSHNGGITSYQWTDPDGDVITNPSPSFSYTVPVLDDGVTQELTFGLVVIDDLGLSSESVGVTITANDLPNVYFDPASYTVVEGGVDLGSDITTSISTIDTSNGVDITVRVAGVMNGSMEVSYKTVDGNVQGDGSEGSDYVASNGTLVFSDTVNTAIIHVPIVADFDSENGSEFFYVELFDANNVEIVGTRATINIIDDDSTVEHTLTALNPVFSFETDSAESNLPLSFSITADQLATDSDGDNLSVENCNSLFVEDDPLGGGGNVDLSIVNNIVKFSREDRSCFIKAMFTCRVIDNTGLWVDSQVVVNHDDGGLCG